MARMRAGWLTLVVVALGMEADAGPTRVSGQVVGADGMAVTGADVATLWDFTSDNLRPQGGGKTDGNGRFQFEVNLHERPDVLVAIDRERKLGGLVTVDPNKQQKFIHTNIKSVAGEQVKPGANTSIEPVEIKLGPMIRVHGNFSCTEQNGPPGWINVRTYLDAGKILMAQSGSTSAAFDFKLPAGSYLLNGSGTIELQGFGRKLELRADKPDVDLGTIDFKLSPLGKMYGKEAPPLHITDARGIGKDVKLADFRGKWVVLDFWGYWCGPCVGRSLPDLMQIYDEHPDDRDKFVILAFHDKQAEDFEQLDRRMKPTVASTWGGRELPFPILLDSSGRTVEEYGIQSWPTTILIDPDGQVVRGGEDTLRKVLPPVAASRRLTLAIDKETGFGVSDDTTLAAFAKSIGRKTQLNIRLDEPSLRAAGVTPDAPIALDVSGKLSLRSWLELALRPLGLVAVSGPEGLVITTTAHGSASEPSAVQVKAAARIEAKLGEPTTFEFTGTTLREVAIFFQLQTGEPFVLDPAAILAGRLDPKAAISGNAEAVPLRKGLQSLLGPLGIEVVVRDEVVILGKPAQP